MPIHFPKNLLSTLKKVRHVVALTGAGVSAESGVPTFREAQTGLWEQYKPEELATPQAFSRDPQMVWAWYHWRRELISTTNPNSGHYALAAMESRLHEKEKVFTLLTQNVDNLHQRAGSKEVLALHGNIFRTKCFECRQIAPSSQSAGQEIPRCPQCDGLLRPDVVWFGESLSQTVLNTALKATKHCNVFFSIGTSSVVQPAASLPFLAKENNAIIVEINPNTTPLTNHADYVFQAASGEVLPALVSSIWED